MANDRFVPTESLLRNLPEGVTVTSLAKAAVLYPEIVGRYYNRIAATDRGEVPLALNTLFAQEGIFYSYSQRC